METINSINPKQEITETVTQEGTIEAQSFKKNFESRNDAMITMDVLDEIGFSDRYQIENNGKSIVLTNVTDEDLALLQRKVNIATWSRRTIQVAHAVTNFASDIADYTLNGAVAPTVGAVADAALTTGRVVGTAAVKTGAMVATSVIKNGRAAATELYNSKELRDCGNEIKGCWSDIASHLFGSTGKSSNSWEAC